MKTSVKINITNLPFKIITQSKGLGWAVTLMKSNEGCMISESIFYKNEQYIRLSALLSYNEAIIEYNKKVEAYSAA